MEGAPVVLVNEGDNDLPNLPPGFRFHPTDEEIIIHYLTQKVLNSSFRATAIGEVNLNKCEPWDLPKKAKMGEKEWYFFCQKDRKYPTGMRTNRATELGYWKATGKDKEIYQGKRGSNGQLIGMKKTLVFYKGRAPKGEKSNWVMHEFRVEGKFSYYNFSKATKDEWVVCKVFHKNGSGLMINRSSTADLKRMNSFVNSLLDDSSSLPPLASSPPLSGNRQLGADTPEEDVEFRGIDKALSAGRSSMSTGMTSQPQENNYSYNIPTTANYQASSSNYQMSNNLNFYTTQIGPPIPNASCFPYGQALHQKEIGSMVQNIPGLVSLMGNKNMYDQTNIRALTANKGAMLSELGQQYCKVEQLSSSNVSLSQDTGLSTDMTQEISSVQVSMDGRRSKGSSSYLEGPSSLAALSDFDSDALWNYL